MLIQRKEFLGMNLFNPSKEEVRQFFCEAWAKQHHEYWYDDVKSGKIPAQRSEPVAPGQTVQI